MENYNEWFISMEKVKDVLYALCSSKINFTLADNFLNLWKTIEILLSQSGFSEVAGDLKV